MIEQLNPVPGHAALRLRLRPNRSASATQLVAFFSAIALAALGTAWFAASQGNVYAPMFALLDVAVVGAAFWAVRKGSEREELIAIDPEAIVVRRRPGGSEARFHPYWVKLVEEPGRTRNERARMLLTSHGNAVEIGRFLGDEERAELRDRLKEALAAARAGAR